jgi:hypothetical protein
MYQNTFNDLSAFYINLWQYLNTFFNDSRWSQVHPNGTSKLDRFHLLESSLERLRSDQLDGTIDAQFEQDFALVEQMLKEYDAVPLESWLKGADKLRTYAQELGLRYAEMAATSNAAQT